MGRRPVTPEIVSSANIGVCVCVRPEAVNNKSHEWHAK